MFSFACVCLIDGNDSDGVPFTREQLNQMENIRAITVNHDGFGYKQTASFALLSAELFTLEISSIHHVCFTCIISLSLLFLSFFFFFI